MTRRGLAFALAASLFAGCTSASAPLAGTPPAAPLRLEPCRVPGVATELRCGVLQVEENRERPNGRRLPLKVIVVPAASGATAPDPVFFLAGGPGQAATDLVPGIAEMGALPHRELVFVDQRGTGEGHRLDCDIGDAEADPQLLLQPLFSEGAAVYRACRQALEREADLTQYGTVDFIADLEQVREALGYERINLEGGSYGTRAAFIYMQMHPQRIRSALLNGVSTLDNRAPLYHAAAAQRAFDLMVEQCHAEAACRAAFPTIREDLAAIRARLRAEPVAVEVPHPITRAAIPLRLGETAFTDGLRVMLYSAQSARAVPLLLQRGRAGELAPFAAAALQSSLGFRQGLRLGLLLSVSCSEDVARIRPDEVERETAGSFIGDHRVRGQIEACAQWPRADVPARYFEPRPLDIPTLILSGNLDPVTPPHWGEGLRRWLPNSLHLIGVGAHTAMDECLERIRRDFFASGTVGGLDTQCLGEATLPPFMLPPQGAGAGD